MKNQLALIFGLALGAAAPAAAAGGIYSVNSAQLFSQFSASSPVPPPLGFNFVFSAQAPTAATLKGFQVTQPLLANATNQDFELTQAFTTNFIRESVFASTSLGYTLSGPGFSTVTLFTSGGQTIAIPYVLGGKWQNRVLVLDPTQDNTVDLIPFTQYGTFPVGSRMSVRVTSLDSDHVNFSQQVATVAIAGSPVAAAPFTSFVLPKDTLQAGLCYQGTVSFDAIISLDTTTNASGPAVGSYSIVVNFFIVASPPSSVPAPTIATQPVDQVAAQGTKATFNAAVAFGGASQPANTSVIWYANGLPVDYTTGKYTLGTSGALTINNVTAADAGGYGLVVVNAGGLAQSQNASLTVTTAGASAPTITVQPLNVIVNIGSTAALKVSATSTTAISYQWSKDGVVVPGATSDTLIIPNYSPSNSGAYTVLVSDSSGSVTSSPGRISATTDTIGRISNLSVRTNLAAAQTLTMGFVTSGPKSMLLRAVGPSLNPVFGLGPDYADPKLTVLDRVGNVLGQNDDWSSTLVTTFAGLGAFALTPASKDAALLLPVNGPATAQINGTGSGFVLAEVYDAEAAGAPAGLVNVSARNQVGTGGNVLISGFVITGIAGRTVLIRGAGPALHDVFGVTGQLVDPVLEVHLNYIGADLVLASSDDWNASLAPIFTQVGAYQFLPGSKDAALVVTLPAGVYTVQLSGKNLGTGDGVIEIYALP